MSHICSISLLWELFYRWGSWLQNGLGGWIVSEGDALLLPSVHGLPVHSFKVLGITLNVFLYFKQACGRDFQEPVDVLTFFEETFGALLNLFLPASSARAQNSLCLRSLVPDM